MVRAAGGAEHPFMITVITAADSRSNLKSSQTSFLSVTVSYSNGLLSHRTSIQQSNFGTCSCRFNTDQIPEQRFQPLPWRIKVVLKTVPNEVAIHKTGSFGITGLLCFLFESRLIHFLQLSWSTEWKEKKQNSRGNPHCFINFFLDTSFMAWKQKVI